MAQTATDQRGAIHGHIAARVDRLPLTRVQWQLAILVEITWGFIIFDTDGIGARLYPFVWRPHHIIDVYQYAVIQALQVGAGILLGVYLMSWVADRYGRRPAILLATLLGGICIWPFAYVTNFWGMVVLSVLSTLGVGGIVATHSVYLSEMTSPLVRNRVLLASQGVTALVAVGVNLLAFWLIPAHWQAFLWVSAVDRDRDPAAAAILEAAGIAALAGGARPARRKPNARWRNTKPACSAQRRPAAGAGRAENPVVMAGPGAWKELFTNPQYRSRTWRADHLLDAGYAGLIYGVGAFIAVFMVDHGGVGALRLPDHRRRLRCVVHGVPGQRAARRAGGTARRHRRDGDAVRGMLGGRLAVPSLAVIAVCYIISRIGTGLFLFNLYNYTAVAYPTRIRSVAFAWTDGLGHLGAWGGVTLLGPLYSWAEPSGWILGLSCRARCCRPC